MAKYVKESSAKAAEKAKPGWTVVEPAQADTTPGAKPDASVPELQRLHRKYFGTDRPTDAQAPSDEADLLVMETTPASRDSRVGRVRVVVEKDKVTGEQG